MINIKSYSKQKSKTGVTGGGGGLNYNTNTEQPTGVYLWGQYHDHTKNISGDLTDVGNITAEGNITTSGSVEAHNVSANTVTSTYGEITNVIADDVTTDVVNADNGNIDNVISELVRTDNLNALQGIISELVSDNITTQNLNVTQQAHFFELIIDKIKSAGGSVILTPVDGFRTDLVKDSGTFQYNLIKYADNDQIFIKDQPFYFSWGNAPKGNNILAEITTAAHNIKYFYSAGQNQRSALLYADGTLKTGTYGNANDSFVSPYIYVGDISTIHFQSDGLPQASGAHAKLAAYDEDLQYIQSNSIANQQTFTWTKGSTTKWIRFTGRNTFTNGKIYINNQTTGDITIKFMWCDYPKNGNSSPTMYIPKVVGNNIKSFKLYRDNTNTIYKQTDETILNAVPVINEDGKGKLYDTISQTFCSVSNTTNDYTGEERVTSGYTDINGYKLYFQSNDGVRAIKNMWQVNDQALCETFNNAVVGNSQQISNKYYWALVTGVGTETINNTEYHYIKISNTTYDGTLNPTVGDEIAMLGSRDQTDLMRQSAIYIAAYNSIDYGIDSPLIAQYEGINDFDLASHRTNVISNGLVEFKGKFTTTNGDDIEDLINDVGQGAISYVHQAFANSADGSVGFSKTYFTGAKYMGFCSNHTSSDSALVYTDYEWMVCKGEDGADGVNGTSYYMISDIASINVKDDVSTTPNIVVHGYKLEGNSRVEKNNTCIINYNGLEYSDNDVLPVTITPSTMEREFAGGLQSINIQMYDDNAVNIVSSFEIPVIRNGEDGADGNNGVDARNYKLVPINEDLSVNTGGTLTVTLSYNIIEIIGNTYTTKTASDTLYVRFQSNLDGRDTYINLSTGTTTPSYSNLRYQSNWKNQTFGQIQYITVELVNGTGRVATVLDRRVVYVVLKPMATFSITDSINATVQGHTTQIGQNTNAISSLQIDVDGIETTVDALSVDVDTVQQNITSIEQDIDSITSTVQQHTTSISGITSDISTIEQNIDSISSRVTHTERKIIGLSDDERNLFGSSTYAGSDFEEGNRWLFESYNLDCTFDYWDKYHCIFDKGECDGQIWLGEDGEVDVFTPYLYLQSGQYYTLNCDFYGYDGDTAIKVYRYATKADAQNLQPNGVWYMTQQGVLQRTKPNNIYIETDSVIQFTLPQNAYYRICFCDIVNLFDEDLDYQICLSYVKLYKGQFSAGDFWWSEQVAENYSEIYQSAGEIKLSVDDVNLRIDNQGIELNGDTTINGNLTLNSTDQGFILHNENGSTQLSPQSIGTFNEFAQRNKVVSTKSLTNTQVLGLTSNGQVFVYANYFIVDLGTIKANSQLTFDNSSIVATYHNSTITPVNTSVFRQIYENGTLQQTTPNYLNNYTVSGNSNVVIQYQVMLHFSPSQFATTSPKVKVDFNIDITMPATALMVIGYDGVGINYGTTKTVYLGQDETTFKYGNTKLQVCEDNVNVATKKVNQNDSVISLTSYNQLPMANNVRLLGFSSNSSYTATADDTIIIVNNSSRSGAHNIYLPLPSTCNGKVFYIKNIVGGKTVNVKVNGTSEDLIIEADGNIGTATDNISIGNRSYMFISIYDYYIVYYCG